MKNGPAASVRCQIGLKSMNLPYIFVSLRNDDNEVACVWAKPDDLYLAEQPIKGKMLEGWIHGTILEEKRNTFVVSFYSNGSDKKIITVPRESLMVL